MNPEKKEKLATSDIPVIDLTMDDSNESEVLTQNNDDGVTKEVFEKKAKGNSPVSQEFKAGYYLSTYYQKIAKLFDRTGVSSSISELKNAEYPCLASVLKSESKKDTWMLKTDDERVSKKNVAEVTSMPRDPWSSQQPRGTCANDETLVRVMEIAEQRKVEAINAGRKPSEKQFHTAKLDFVGPASRLENKEQSQPSSDAAFREALIYYPSPPSGLNHSYLDSKPHTPVVGQSSSYPKLVRITVTTNWTPPADPRLRARTSSLKLKSWKVTDIPLMNKDSSSINMQESPKKFRRPWE